jgi:Cytochrome c oxidase subunit IV
MSTIARIFVALAVFLVIAALVYGSTSHERGGTALLLVAGATFLFLGLVARKEARHEAEGASSEEEPHVGPTIWPLGFAVSSVIIALGLIVDAWILILGAVVFALSAAGWFRDVARSRANVGHHQ